MMARLSPLPVLILSMALLRAVTAADAPAITAGAVAVVWQGDPIGIDLPVGSERRIDFPEPISDLDVPQVLSERSRIVLTPSGELHWQARAVFDPARVLATSVTGSLYQLDVGARDTGTQPLHMQLIDPLLLDGPADAVPARAANAAALQQAAADLIPDFLKNPIADSGRGQVDYVALARFALSHFSGPSRLIPKLEATPLPVRPLSSRQLLRVQSRFLTVRPLAQWQAGSHFVTALAVYNQSAQTVTFDPRALRRDVQFIAALHSELLPAGSGHNGTVWAVVTDRPFNQLGRRP